MSDARAGAFAATLPAATVMLVLDTNGAEHAAERLTLTQRKMSARGSFLCVTACGPTSRKVFL